MGLCGNLTKNYSYPQKTKLQAEQKINNSLEEADICIINDTCKRFLKDNTFPANVNDSLPDLP